MLRSNLAWAPELLSLCSRVQEPHLLGPQSTATEAHTVPMLRNMRSHRSEKSAHRSESGIVKSSPHSPQLEKSWHGNEDPAQPEINNKNK